MFPAIVLSLKGYAQNKTGDYKIDLKMLKSTYSLKERGGRIKLNFVVTVTNLGKDKVSFGPYLMYSYKEYKDQDYYLEATDLNGVNVNIFGNTDIDWLFDPAEGKSNINKIVDTISTDIYVFTEGKYRIRWVYDPAGNGPAPATNVKPIYSNWQKIEVVK